MLTNFSRFLISAAHKSSGKTTVSIGLCAALKQRGLQVQPFKKGPDYIDPKWLAQAAAAPCYNLDPYLSSQDEIEHTFQQRSARADVCLLEGNKGLYDGVALDGSNSNAALAILLKLPVILVLDARGMTRGIAPLILGYQAFDPRIQIAGVILNRVGGKRHEEKLRAVMAQYTTVPVIGALPETPEFCIDERHLGLVPSNEEADAAGQIKRLAAAIDAHVDIDRLLALTRAETLPDNATTNISTAASTPALASERLRPQRPASRAKLRIGIARDAAFGFYYPDDLEGLQRAGAQLVPFDTLRDAELPAVDGLFIGGGFPEMLAAELEGNTRLRQHLRRQIENGLPVYAECGGLMYLTRSISWQGKLHAMVGAIPADTVMHRRPVGRGYIEIEASSDHPWFSATPQAKPRAAQRLLRGHEFHYSSLENLAPDLRYAWRVSRGYGIDGAHDGIVHRNVLGAYAHLRSTLEYDWPAHFVAFVGQCKTSRVAPHAALPHYPARPTFIGGRMPQPQRAGVLACSI